MNVTQTGAMKTVASTLDSVIQNVKTDASDQPTQTVKTVYAIPIEMKTTSVSVTLTGPDQTVASIWDTVTIHVTDVMDHQSMMYILKMLAFVTSV